MIELFKWKNIEFFLNTAFVSSLVASLAGAFSGALAAHSIAKWEKYRDENLKEVRDVNIAISICAGILNSLLVFKGDLIKPLSEKYVAKREEFIRVLEECGVDNDKEKKQIRFEIDYVHPVTVVISQVQDIIVDRINIGGRDVLLVFALGEVIEALSHTVLMHNELVDKIKNNDLPKGVSREFFYFGVRNENSVQHNEYRDVINNLLVHVDFALFAVNLICRDLYGYAVGLPRKNKFLRGKMPKIIRVDPDGSRYGNLIPKDDEYKSWFEIYDNSDGHQNL
ncbi:MAG: hypothetical protein ACP5R6_00020 [Chlorobaculum sp.]